MKSLVTRLFRSFEPALWGGPLLGISACMAAAIAFACARIQYPTWPFSAVDFLTAKVVVVGLSVGVITTLALLHRSNSGKRARRPHLPLAMTLTALATLVLSYLLYAIACETVARADATQAAQLIIQIQPPDAVGRNENDCRRGREAANGFAVTSSIRALARASAEAMLYQAGCGTEDEYVAQVRAIWDAFRGVEPLYNPVAAEVRDAILPTNAYWCVSQAMHAAKGRADEKVLNSCAAIPDADAPSKRFG